MASDAGSRSRGSLAGRPDVYVLDEPTAGLDEALGRVVLDAVDEPAAAVLVATHDARVAAWDATRALGARGTRRSTFSR